MRVNNSHTHRLLAGAILGCLLLGKSIAPAQSTGTQSIPERPEALDFPPLQYQPPEPADYRVELDTGPVAYIVPDPELPLVNIAVYIRAGEYLVPKGKEGLANLTGYLLARGGTESQTAEELEERLAFLAADLDSGFGDTQGSVSLNLLSKDLPEGMDILREVLTAPRFQPDKIELRRQQMIQSMKERNDDPADIEARERGFLAYGEDFWANRYQTKHSVESLSRADLETFHEKWVHPENFVLAVNGDFKREAMIRKLEELFADWPFEGEKAPPVPADVTFAASGVYLVDKEVNQGRVSILLPGILRENPDYLTIQVMNDILGGGGFASRLVNRVRSDEGLAYSAGSRFPGGVHYPQPFHAAFQSKSRTVPYAASIVLEEIRKIKQEPVTEEELTTAKNSFIDTLPQHFATKRQIAQTFARDEFTGRYDRDPHFWNEFRSRIEAVGRSDVRRVAEEFLPLEKRVILVVGDKATIREGHPDHPVDLSDLTDGEVTELPLRDPLTMEPMEKGD